MKPISTGSRARSIGIPSSATTTRNCPTISTTRNTYQFRIRELDLGKPLVLDFAREFLPDDYDEVRHIFSRRGAYRRYKELLVRRDALERWYDFSNKSEAAALREWCAENGIDLSGT